MQMLEQAGTLAFATQASIPQSFEAIGSDRKATGASASIPPMNFVFAAMWISRIRWSANRKWKCWSAQKPFAICWPAPVRFVFERDIQATTSQLGFIRGRLAGQRHRSHRRWSNERSHSAFPDEFGPPQGTRPHRADLALVGLPLLGHVEAHKAGHALHTQLVSRLLGPIPRFWDGQPTHEALHTRFQEAPLASFAPVSAAD